MKDHMLFTLIFTYIMIITYNINVYAQIGSKEDNWYTFYDSQYSKNFAKTCQNQCPFSDRSKCQVKVTLQPNIQKNQNNSKVTSRGQGYTPTCALQAVCSALQNILFTDQHLCDIHLSQCLDSNDNSQFNGSVLESLVALQQCDQFYTGSTILDFQKIITENKFFYKYYFAARREVDYSAEESELYEQEFENQLKKDLEKFGVKNTRFLIPAIKGELSYKRNKDYVTPSMIKSMKLDYSKLTSHKSGPFNILRIDLKSLLAEISASQAKEEFFIQIHDSISIHQPTILSFAPLKQSSLHAVTLLNAQQVCCVHDDHPQKCLNLIKVNDSNHPEGIPDWIVGDGLFDDRTSVTLLRPLLFESLKRPYIIGHNFAETLRFNLKKPKALSALYKEKKVTFKNKEFDVDHSALFDAVLKNLSTDDFESFIEDGKTISFFDQKANQKRSQLQSFLLFNLSPILNKDAEKPNFNTDKFLPILKAIFKQHPTEQLRPLLNQDFADDANFFLFLLNLSHNFHHDLNLLSGIIKKYAPNLDFLETFHGSKFVSPLHEIYKQTLKDLKKAEKAPKTRKAGKTGKNEEVLKLEKKKSQIDDILRSLRSTDNYKVISW